MSNRKATRAVGVLLAVLLFQLRCEETGATGNTSHWQTIGAGCASEDNAIQNDLYDILGHGIKFKPSKHGVIRLICPVTVNRRANKPFDMFFKDGDGQGTDFEIRANL
jgi:hypothetical protein